MLTQRVSWLALNIVSSHSVNGKVGARFVTDARAQNNRRDCMGSDYTLIEKEARAAVSLEGQEVIILRNESQSYDYASTHLDGYDLEP